MHLRFSHCIGLPITEEDNPYNLGSIVDVLIHPDTGNIEGFFVKSSSWFQSDTLFLSVLDIESWHKQNLLVPGHSALSNLEDNIRCHEIYNQGRLMLSQSIRTESGAYLGRCKDVQFNTKYMKVEWIFPRWWWKWLTPISLKEVIEVQEDAIIVRDSMKGEYAVDTQIEAIDSLATATEVNVPSTRIKTEL